MHSAYPAINQTLDFPVGRLSRYNTAEDDYTNEALDNGWKQRLGDMRALDKDMSEREKDQEAFDRGSKYKDHLLSGGDWKMTPERGLTSELIEAIRKVAPQYSAEDLRKAAAHDEAQVRSWRTDLRVKNELAKIRAKKAAAALKDGEAQPLSINLPE